MGWRGESDGPSRGVGRPKLRNRPLRTVEPTARSAPKLTPPCGCGYPLLQSDTSCPRCKAAR